MVNNTRMKFNRQYYPDNKRLPGCPHAADNPPKTIRVSAETLQHGEVRIDVSAETSQGEYVAPTAGMNPRCEATVQTGRANPRREPAARTALGALRHHRHAQHSPDTAQRVLQGFHAASKRDAHVARCTKARPRNYGHTGFDQQVFGEVVVVL
jgi:hypothetical protein